ncbi:MAG: site-specific DNA-methyltransferase [Halanaerobiales bacterium]|nr:site-specific DNA-methyltransferase [Halanaerobiales bacterium]
MQLKFTKKYLTHHLFNEDCLSLLPKLPKGKIDLILTDPPFCISQNTIIKRDDCVDYNLDFGDWDNNKVFPEDWIPLVVPLMKQDTGVIITFTGKRLAERTIQALEKEGCYYRILGSWFSPSFCPMFRAKTWASATNMFVIATMQKKNIHHFASNLKQHPDYILVPVQGALQYNKERTKYPHQCMKPRRVIEELMKYWSWEGDVVLDLFSGVSTTSLIAEILMRNSISIERDSEYYNTGKERLKNQVNNTKLFNLKSKIVEHKVEK